MSSDVALSVNNISKCYLIYDRPQDRLKQSIFRSRRYYREFWALKDVSFEVRKGETVGIIGRNGSGKSTLLQIITGILTPTSGQININGRVAALLELGSGFNPDFTGRENALMSGAIMGFTTKEILERMPLIEKFAEIGDFIDQPVKIYSSGMYVRLAFACAVNVDPDILVVDEALAVGDLQFQLKCIDKMKSFKKQGKTILFVSHDTNAARNFCDQAVWMMEGRIYLRGEVNTVMDLYNDYMKVETENAENPTVLDSSRRNVLTINDVYFLNNKGKQSRSFKPGEEIKVTIEYTLHSCVSDIIGGVALFDRQHVYVCGLNTKLDEIKLPSMPGKYKLMLSYSDINLLPGTYYVDIGFYESSGVVSLDYQSKIKSFFIESDKYLAQGLVMIKHYWNV